MLTPRKSPRLAFAALFFVLGIFVATIVVSTTQAANAQFRTFNGYRRPNAAAAFKFTTNSGTYGNTRSVIASQCGAGYTVIGGGYQVTAGAEPIIWGSYPLNNGWQLNASSPVGSSVTVYASCAQN
jgi:hypothetical protein